MKMNSINAKQELLMFIILFISRTPFGFGSFFFFFLNTALGIFIQCVWFYKNYKR